MRRRAVVYRATTLSPGLPWNVKNLLLTSVYFTFELCHFCSWLLSFGFDCPVFPGTPSTLRGWKLRLATRSRRLFQFAARHRACLGGSFGWFSNVPGSQIRSRLYKSSERPTCSESF